MITQKPSTLNTRDLTNRNMAQPTKRVHCSIPTVQRMNNLLFLAKALSR